MAEQWRSALEPVKAALIRGGESAVHGVCTVTGLGACGLDGLMSAGRMLRSRVGGSVVRSASDWLRGPACCDRRSTEPAAPGTAAVPHAWHGRGRRPCPRRSRA